MLGKIVKELEVSEGNSRNSEGSFIEVGDRLYFAYSRYRSRVRNDDHDAADIAVVYSDDGGETFGDAEVIVKLEDCGGTTVNLMSVSLLNMSDGSVGVFYLKKDRGLQCRMFYRTTRDFKAFSNETQVIRDEGYFVVNNDRVRRLSCGSILVPAAKHGVTERNGALCVDAHAVACFYVSTDDGKTFTRRSLCEMPFKLFATGLQEPGTIELKDGRLLAYFRNSSGRQFTAVSYDKAKSWSPPEPSRFLSPISPMSMQRVDDKIIAVYNPVPISIRNPEMAAGNWTGGRTPLILEYSDDECESFKPYTVIEDDRERGFCYTAIYAQKDSILLSYCSGGALYGHSTLNRTTIRKILKSEVFA